MVGRGQGPPSVSQSDLSSSRPGLIRTAAGRTLRETGGTSVSALPGGEVEPDRTDLTRSESVDKCGLVWFSVVRCGVTWDQPSVTAGPAGLTG